jgi:ribonucleotide reductase beta subunit family protein with ferritin-like domain
VAIEKEVKKLVFSKFILLDESCAKSIVLDIINHAADESFRKCHKAANESCRDIIEHLVDNVMFNLETAENLEQRISALRYPQRKELYDLLEVLEDQELIHAYMYLILMKLQLILTVLDIKS